MSELLKKLEGLEAKLKEMSFTPPKLVVEDLSEYDHLFTENARQQLANIIKNEINEDTAVVYMSAKLPKGSPFREVLISTIADTVNKLSEMGLLKGSLQPLAAMDLVRDPVTFKVIEGELELSQATEKRDENIFILPHVPVGKREYVQRLVDKTINPNGNAGYWTPVLSTGHLPSRIEDPRE